jgi:NAD(P)-dependent dehydrogenase (short-subunit alcohol dehydrogenase family)
MIGFGIRHRHRARLGIQPGGVLVTGASTGIGAAITRQLAKQGFEVFGTVRRPADGQSLETAGVTPVLMDVTDVESIACARQVVAETLGGRPLRGLVNNAGIATGGPVELVPLDEVRGVFEVNVLGVVAVTQAFLPLLRAARGRIVNISSLSSRVALPFVGAYAASKSAVEGLSDSLRRELADAGVRVVVVQPGTVRTPIWDKLAAVDHDRFRGSVYEEPLRRVRELALAGGSQGLPPEAVARAVGAALTARRPPTRIVVARGSYLARRVVYLLPGRWIDHLILRRIENAAGPARSRPLG